jgi:hypothetical protein
VGPSTSLDDVKRRKILPLSGLELQPLGRPARSQSLYRLRSRVGKIEIKNDAVPAADMAEVFLQLAVNWPCATCAKGFRCCTLLLMCDRSSVLLAPLYVARFIAWCAGLMCVSPIILSPRKTSTLRPDCILTLLTSTLKMEVAFCCETLVSWYTTTRCHVFACITGICFCTSRCVSERQAD